MIPFSTVNFFVCCRLSLANSVGTSVWVGVRVACMCSASEKHYDLITIKDLAIINLNRNLDNIPTMAIENNV